METIFEAIKCIICQNVLDGPVILPCGNSICKKHLCETNEQIWCPRCSKFHSGRDFPPNGGLEKIISTRIEKFDFGEEHRQAINSCKKLEHLINTVKTTLGDQDNCAHYCVANLKNRVDIRREELKLEIDERANRLHKNLDLFLRECNEKKKREFSKTLDIDNICKSVEKSEKSLHNWLEKLKALKVDTKEWAEINSICVFYTKRLETEFSELENMLISSQLSSCRRDVQDFEKLRLNDSSWNERKDSDFSLEY